MPPKFRKTNRLLKWMAENCYGKTRLPKECEAVFFKTNETECTVAQNLVHYADETYQDNLDVELENLILKDASSTVNYIHHLTRHNKSVRPEIIYSLKGNGKCLSQISRNVGRLPLDLEACITDPADFLTYVAGLRNRGEKHRIVEMENRIFLADTDNPCMASFVAKYAQYIGELPQEFKDVLKKDGEAIMEYQNYLSRNYNKLIDDELRDCLAGNDRNLLKFASNYLHKRLPEHLEKTLTDPGVIYNYARSIVRNRLPEELENHLAKDYGVAVQYAFEVIRAYACVRLPEVVHSAMVMKSFELPHDSTIKRYINECEKDTTVPGSW